MEKLYENFKKYAKKAYKQVEPLVPFSNANQYAFNPRSELHNNSQALDIQNDTDILNQQMANYRANQNGTFMLNALTKSDKEKQKDSIDFDNKFIDLAYSKGYTPHKAIDKDGKARYAIEKDGVFKEIEPSFLNNLKANSYEMLGSLAGVATALPHPLTKTAGVAGKILTPMVGSAVGSGAGAMADTYLNNKSVGENTTAEQLANSFIGGANNDILAAGLATTLTSKPAINIAKGTLKAPLEVLDKGLTGIGARHILSQNIGGAGAALKANLGGDHEFRNALDSAKDALGADLDNFVSKGVKTIDKTSDNRYIQKGIDIANSAINKANETLKGLNVGRADAELLLSALGHENGVKNILDSVANNPQSAQKITEISSNLNKSFAGSINEQLAKFETQTPKDSFKNSFNQVKKDYADTKDFLIKNSNYQSDFKELSENLATILSDTQNINTRGVFNALNGGGNLENLLNAKNAINEQLGYIMSADFKSSSDFINQKALNEAKSLIDNEINTALKNDERLMALYRQANDDYAKMKNISESNLMNQISRDGKTSIEALNAMLKSSDNINGVTLNDFLGSLGAKDRAIAEANLIKGLMDKNSVNGVVDFRALNESLAKLDFQSEFAKELKGQILSKQSILNNTSDILNSLGDRVVKPKTMSQGISTDPLKRAETMKANFIVEKIKPLIPRLGNNEALKLHLNRAILNANGDFKLAIKNIENIPDGNLPTPTRNLLNEFKNALKDIEQVVKSQANEPTQIAKQEAQTTPNLAQNSIKGDGFVTYPNSARQETAINQNFNIQEWVKNMSGVLSDEWRANLSKLADKHPEMFRSEADVFRVIKEIKDNPTHFFKNYDDDISLIGKQINDNKFANIGIVKDNGEIIHANKNKIKDLDRLQRRNKEMLTGTPLPATTRANSSMEGDLLQHSDTKTIPNQTIKEAENQANLAKITAEFSKAYNAIKNIGKYTGLFENDYKKIASLSTKDFTQRLKNDIQAYEELAGLQEIAYKATNGLLNNDEYMRYFNVRQGEKGYLTKAQSIQNNAFEILDQAPNYISGLYNEISRLKALKSLSKEQDEALNKALKQVNQNAILDLAGETNYKLMATKAKTALNALTRAKKILDEALTPVAKDPLADAPSELYKAHRKAQLAKEQTQKTSNETQQLRKTEQLQTKEQAQKTSHQKRVDDLIATPKEQWSKEQKEFFDNLPSYKKDQILEIPKIKHDEEVFGKIPYNELSDRNQIKIIDEAKNSPKGKELQAQYDKLKAAKYTKAEGGKYPSGAQLAKITKAQNKIIAQRDELINSYIKEYDEKVARNSKILTNQDIKEQISKWDLNAPKQTLITNKIDGEELEKLNEHFKFKGNYPLTRQIDSEHIKHALNHHGDEKTEALRGQKAITLDDISNYENYAKTADIKEYSDKKVISKKQINGHFVVVEEALTGKNRLNFVSMWYVKGKIKDVAPVSTPKNDLDRTLSNRYDSSNSTPKEIKSQEPTPQAKADEVDINPKSNYKKHERPIELDFKEAIDKGFNVDINALKHFYKNSGNSPLNYMREYMAELDQIEKKALGNEAKDRLKALYENFFYSVKAVERHKPNQIAEYSSIGGQKEFEKIKEFRNEIEKAPTNQKALDALEKIEFVNNLENSPAFKLAKRQKTMKKEFVKEARNALKQATNLALKPLSQFLIKYGKSEEFLTKSSIISKIELENARGLRELKLNIRPIREFGTNYAEFYRDGQNAIKKLLTERQGQVAGAFEREELGDIDLVWGEITDAIKHKGYGLSHILDKRMAEFMEQGLSKEQAEAKAIELINKLPDIIKNGEIIKKPNEAIQIITDDTKIVLKSNYYGEPTNKWIVTAYERLEKDLDISAKPITKGTNSPLNSKPNSTPKEIKSQAQVEQKAKQYAKFLAEANEPTQDAPNELYKAYTKAKKDIEKPSKKDK